MVHARVVLLVLLLLLPTVGFTGGEDAASITGTVYYRERIALPPGVLVTVRLEDVSLQDAPSELIGQTRFPATKGPPYEFVLRYDPALVDERNSYALRATLTLDGKLMFTSTRHYPAFADGRPVEILVRRTPTNPLGSPE
jgi:putative lipoprotein